MTHPTSKGMDEDRTRGYVPPKVKKGPKSKSMGEDRTRGIPNSAGKAKRGWGKAKQ